MKRVDLVFRRMNERTAARALELALRNVRPDCVHEISGVTPFANAVSRMLELEHDCDSIVYLDADCLILEDLRPFLEFSSAPSVDALVRDRLRGRARAGLHIVRRDLFEIMRELPAQGGSAAAKLRPESTLRKRALSVMGSADQVKAFNILHDHLQYPAAMFQKAASRELRSRTSSERRMLDTAMRSWSEHIDFEAARAGIAHARSELTTGFTDTELAGFFEELPSHATRWAERAGASADEQLSVQEIEACARETRGPRERVKHKVFCIGLSRTGTHSLTDALAELGFELAHYPVDEVTLSELKEGKRALSLLEHYDGLSDITAAARFRQLDRAYPGAKFILTLRDRQNWLASVRRTWNEKESKPLPTTTDGQIHSATRALLREQVYGVQSYDRSRLSRAYDEHVDAVREHFAQRPELLLEMDLENGDGWKKLAGFLGRPAPDSAFPHSASKGARPAVGWRANAHTVKQSVRRKLALTKRSLLSAIRRT